jgi:hypothetical protein
MIGAIRQEILSGIRASEQYRKLRDRLRAFSDESLDEADYEEAASCFNRCRAKGLQGSNTDLLICAVSMRRKFAILTTDNDFAGFARILGFELHPAVNQRSAQLVFGWRGGGKIRATMNQFWLKGGWQNGTRVCVG